MARVRDVVRGTKLPRRVLVCSFVALVGLVGCQVANPGPNDRMPYPAPAMVKTLDNVAYGALDQQVLDVYEPANPNGGAILWIHGGAWADANGDPGSLASEEAMGIQPIVSALYRQGWAVFSVRYSGSDEAAFPAPLYDVKTALRWVKRHAGDYGVSANSVVAMGWSSGGHLAALLGTSAGSLEPPGLPTDLARIDSRPAAVVSISGVLDPATFAFNYGLPPGNPQAVASLLGCPTKPDQWQTCNPALLQAARPTTYADRSDPPMYIAIGDRDGIVNPYWQATVPYQALVSKLGDGQVWFDKVDTGSPARYGGQDPRNHTKAISYEINLSMLDMFVDRVLPSGHP